MSFDERLQRALELKAGCLVRSLSTSVAPERLTKGRDYRLTDAPIPLYRDEEKREISRTPVEGGVLCNVLYPIIDDAGRGVEVPQISFERTGETR